MKFKDLIGKTIKTIKKRKQRKYDDNCYLDIEFTDGIKCCIYGGYDDYTGKSLNEYRQFVSLEKFGYEEEE